MDQGTRDNRDKKEQERLEKYKMNKMIVERIPVRHEYQEIGKPSDEIDVEEPEEENQVSRTALFDICNGLNELIADLRRSGGTWNTSDKDKDKFQKLKKIREEAEIEKAKFERVRPKPRGWGYLRR